MESSSYVDYQLFFKMSLQEFVTSLYSVIN